MALVKYKNSAGDWIPVQLSIPTIEVDSFLSSTSTNPVQNKVIKEALDSKVDINAISKVAITGNYSDLNSLPTFKTINGNEITGEGNITIKTEIIDNLESENTTAALSANQGKVLKEMIGQGGGGGVNSTYDIVSVSASGLAPKLELNGNIQTGDWVLSSTNGAAPTWKQILTQVESGTKDTLAYYSDATTVASFDKMVGHTGQPVFINNGVPTPISESIGDAHTPIYMNNGQFYPTTGVRFNQYLYNRSNAGSNNYVRIDTSLTTSAVLDNQIYILYDGVNLTLPDPSSELIGAIVFVKNAYGDSSKVTGKIVGSSQNIADASDSTQTITLANNHSGFFLCVAYGNNYKWVHFYCS